jgi:cytochrome c-type protein NapB
VRRLARRNRQATTLFAFALLAVVAVAVGCGGAEPPGAEKNPAVVRASRRLYDGAPPVIPHENFGMTCTGCHNEQGMAVDEVGFAPPLPHEATDGMGATDRCRQCHVFQQMVPEFVANSFEGLRQDLRRGPRLNPLAPPTIPHKTFMRENCTACHSGVAAREEIRTAHPERQRCRQCHVPSVNRSEFVSLSGPGS